MFREIVSDKVDYYNFNIGSKHNHTLYEMVGTKFECFYNIQNNPTLARILPFHLRP